MHVSTELKECINTGLHTKKIHFAVTRKEQGQNMCVCSGFLMFSVRCSRVKMTSELLTLPTQTQLSQILPEHLQLEVTDEGGTCLLVFSPNVQVSNLLSKNLPLFLLAVGRMVQSKTNISFVILVITIPVLMMRKTVQLFLWIYKQLLLIERELM